MKPSEPPSTDIDLWSDDALRDPYPLWREMRDLGAVVRLPTYDFYALPRYTEMRNALADWQHFSSAQGVMLNPTMNAAQRGATLHTDPPEHRVQRSVVGRPLTLPALRGMEEVFRAAARQLTDQLLTRKTFDAVDDLATYLPMTVVSKQVGLPEEGRERMLAWASAAFDTAGPMNDRAKAGLPVLQEGVAYSYDPQLRERLRPGGWAARLWEAADRGEIPHDKCPALLIDYWGPALDTTIAAIASAIWLFGLFPDQWQLLREQPDLLPSAVNEVLRMESPTPYFSRVTTSDVEMGGVVIPAGSRVLMMYGSANRDERKWEDPERFDIRRRANDQLGFGLGEHVCVGQPLARIEMKAMLGALAERVHRFDLGPMERLMNNMLRQIKSLEVTIVPDGAA